LESCVQICAYKTRFNSVKKFSKGSTSIDYFKTVSKRAVFRSNIQTKNLIPTLPMQHKREGLSCVRTTILTVDDLLNDLETDSGVDLFLNGKVVDEFATVERSRLPVPGISLHLLEI
jgi:hypothetical protein